MRKPTPKDVKALRVDVIDRARGAVMFWATLDNDGDFHGRRNRVYAGRWAGAEVRMVRYLILKDLKKLEYELKHGIGKRMPKRKKGRGK